MILARAVPTLLALSLASYAAAQQPRPDVPPTAETEESATETPDGLPEVMPLPPVPAEEKPAKKAPAKTPARPMAPKKALPDGGPEMYGVPDKAKAAAPKEVSPCAKTFTPLADAYRKAAEDMDRWIKEIDAQTSATDVMIKKLEAEVEANEAKMTKLKLHEDAASQSERRELEKENRQLWADLKTARKDREALCQGLAKQASQRVKEYNVEITERLKQLQSGR
ncbi:MAG: hypothetical protein HY078_04065 [Elusimicrobia bacterium]|nr:hypothetical protein [Elusimicrobiota bacterium]